MNDGLVLKDLTHDTLELNTKDTGRDLVRAPIYKFNVGDCL